LRHNLKTNITHNKAFVLWSDGCLLLTS
jgi:hypothetical protein